MISSPSSFDRPTRAEAVPAAGAGAARWSSARNDRLSTGAAALLRAALDRHPEVRPEVVDRGRLFAADPAYPPRTVLEQIARGILAAPDLSVDES